MAPIPPQLPSKESRRYPWKNALLDYRKLGLWNLYLLFTRIGGPVALFTCSRIAMILEVILGACILRFVKYTEIDWSTYMQQVELFINGEFNYTNIKGDTGPVVYPAGHLYVYSILYFLTSKGQMIWLGQYIFLVIYLLTMAVVAYTFILSNRFPAFGVFVLTCVGYRIHSIYMLRMFNDCVEMLFLYAAVALIVWESTDAEITEDRVVDTPAERSGRYLTSERTDSGKKLKGNAQKDEKASQKVKKLPKIEQNRQRYSLWLAAVLYSIGISIKMNLLLFAPGIAAVVFVKYGFTVLFFTVGSAVAVQLFAATPFFLFYPTEYVVNAFNFGRVFLYKWTVNWKNIDEDLFLNKKFHLMLLALHVFFLLVIAFTLWFRERGGLWKLIWSKQCAKISTHDILKVIFTSNFIGMCFARSLHYQFYSWYYHSFIYLMLTERTKFETMNELTKLLGIFCRISVIVGVELCWNIYPATFASSLSLHFLHIACWVLLYKAHGDVMGRQHEE